MIVDTNFLIDLDTQIPAAVNKAQEIEQAGLSRKIPQVVISELWVSVGMGTTPAKNRRTYQRLLQGLPRADLTETIAKRAGEIHGQSKTDDPNNSGVGLVDAIIAATALQYGEPVVTNNATDFVNRIQQNLGYSSLDVETY